MLNFLRQFRGLSYSDKFYFLGLSLLVPIIKICLHLFGFNRVANFFKHSAKNKKNSVSDLKKIKKYDDLLAFFYRFFPLNHMCLPVSLAFWWLLQREGIETDLRLGMKKDDKTKFLAHAWIEHRGVPFKADKDVREKYTALKESILTRFD